MIEVRIPKEELAAVPNVINRTLTVTQRLQKAGIPVRGDLGIEGLDSGELKMTEDFFDLVFTWEE